MKSLVGQIELEKSVELAKISLINNPDFNAYDAFRIFDYSQSGCISICDFKRGLTELDVFATNEDIQLFFQRYDRD